MRKIFTITFTLLCCNVSAQENKPFELSSRYDNQRNAIIEVKHHDGGRYSVVLQFTRLENFSVQKFHREYVNSNGQLIKLTPSNPERPSNFSYKYVYAHGEVNPRRVDPAFVYRLPFSSSASREVRELYNVYDRYFGGDSRSVDFKAFQFMMNRADTVYAARRGVVIDVIDEYDPITVVGEVGMNTDNNRVLVEHADGTITLYGVLEKGSISVRPGDTVYPDTPIALAGTLDGEIYQTQFSLHYQTDNLHDINDLSDYSLIIHGLDPLFATSEGETTLSAGTTLTPAVSEELVTREMSKRELRR